MRPTSPLQTVDFDRAAFRTGILTAMAIGTAPDVARRPVFVFADTRASTGPVDDEGIPYDLGAVSTTTAGRAISGMLCAVEYLDAVGQVVDMGIVAPTQLRLTLLDAEYQQVKGFDHLLIDGDRYDYRRTEPPIGMVDETVWIIHCKAQDDR